MSKTPDKPNPHDDARMDLLWDYLHGELPEDQTKRFEQTLRDNPELVGKGLDLIELMVMTREVFHRGEAAREEAMLSSVANSGDSGAMEALAELARMEREAPAEMVVLDQPRRRSRRSKKSDEQPLTSQQWLAAGSYLFSHAVKSKAAAVSAIAAMILLALVLLSPWSSTTPDALEVTDNTNDKPADSPPPILRDQPVATLTATHNAVWASPQAEGASAPGSLRSLTPGSKLHPNQRLTLTAGFAEITTNRGAIAILEAPATVELLENNNAIRLYTGKLVGICETDSSKGFLVRTPHMDVTDLGTRFGVDASQADVTEVHVFEGEVQAARSGSEPVLLVAEQSAQASAADDTITAIDHTPERFATIRDQSGLGPPTSTTVLDTDTDGTKWLITTSQHPGTAIYAGNLITCTVDNAGFSRGVSGGNAYGFIQHSLDGAGIGKPATTTGTWTFSNLPAGRYDVATAFNPKDESNSIRYTVNGVEVWVDQSAIPAPDAGPTFKGRRIDGYQPADEIHFALTRSSVVVPEGGSITVTIDNANIAPTARAMMDSVAITLAPEAGQD